MKEYIPDYYKVFSVVLQINAKIVAALDGRS